MRRYARLVLLVLLVLAPKALAQEDKTPLLDRIKQQVGRAAMSVHPFLVPGEYSRFHPLLKEVRQAQNMEPAMVRPEQDEEARRKLDAFVATHKQRPNILIFLVDDLGWGDVGVYGGGEMLGSPTPNIDHLATSGLQLTSTYSQPSCTPTRAAMNTGRLPVRSGLVRPATIGEVVEDAKKEILAARLLSEAGYRTGLSGKWHLGEQPGMYPTDMGYGEFFGMLGVVDQYQDWQMIEHSPEIVTKPERFNAMKQFREPTSWLMQGVAGKPLERVKPMTLETTANMDEDFAAWSQEFIRRAVDDKKPFYLVHAFSKVHFFNIPAKGYAGRSPAGTPFRDALVEVDDIVGRLIDTLKQTGQLENTFVFFTSDNGPEEDSWPDTGHTPFRGAKGTTWEGGVRVPGIAYWPGMIAPGRRSDGLFDLMDLFNTSLALAGAADKIPTDRYIDGIDQTSFLLADKGESRREIVWMWNMYDFSAVRVNEFKSHFRVCQIDNDNVDAMGGLDNSRVMEPLNPWFYNLYDDPKERRPEIVKKSWAAGMLNFPLYQHMMSFKIYPNRPGLPTSSTMLKSLEGDD
jgi:arylsulfatase A-like enzyme